MAEKSKRRDRTLRKSGRVGFYLLLYFALAAVVTGGVSWAYRTSRSHPHFAIATLTVEGASETVEADLLRRLAWVKGRNFFSVDLDRVRQEALGHPWVASVDVRGILPSSLDLRVYEHQPAGLVRIENRVMVITEAGHPIATHAAYRRLLDLPVLIGLDDLENQREEALRGIRVLEEIRKTSLFFWDQIETLDLSDEQNMIIQLRSVEAPIYLGDVVITDNIRNYLTIAHHLERDYPSLSYIELGFPNQIAIMPRKGD